MLDGALERLAALRQPVKVSDGDAGAGDAGRADLLAEVGDRRSGAGQQVRGEAGRIAEGPGEDRQELGRTRRQKVNGVVQRRPQVGAAAEEADHDQRVERLDEDLVVGVVWVVQLLDSSGQQPVGHVDVAVAMEQMVGTRNSGLERAARAGVGAAGLCQQAGGVAQVAGHD